MSKPLTRQAQMRRATLASLLTNLWLSIMQIAGGVLSQSQALIADGLHTLSDLAGDGLVYLTARHSNALPDRDHPYGHRRFETLVSIIIGLVLLGVAVGISLNAADRLLNPETLVAPSGWALAIAFLAIAAKEGLYHYTIKVARQTRSRMLQASAWHHRSDALSSIVVLVGVAGAVLFDLAYLDALAAIVISGMLALIGGKMTWGGVQELLDAALDEDKMRQIGDTIIAVDGVEGFHQLRSRQMGGAALVDVHIEVSPRISVTEGDHIAERVRAALLEFVPEVEDVTIHVDTEDDEHCEDGPCLSLPSRWSLFKILSLVWSDQRLVEHLHIINIYYINERVELDISLPLSLFDDDISAARKAADKLQKETAQVSVISAIRVYWH